MYQLHQNETECLHNDFATSADLCEVFVEDMKPIYLLSFLLTASHETAEECFVATVAERFEEKAVFKEFVESSIKHSIIKNAIRRISPKPESKNQHQRWEPWDTEQASPPLALIDAVTQLPPLERFVFVLSILEGYSARKCSVLLNCSMERVVGAQIAALRKLSSRHPAYVRNLAKPTRRSDLGSHERATASAKESPDGVPPLQETIATLLGSYLSLEALHDLTR